MSVKPSPGWFAVTFVLLLGLLRGEAQAQTLAIAGVQASQTSDFAYVGTLVPVGQAKLGNGYFLSPMLSINRYTFDQNGTGFTGLQPSVSLGLGYATMLANTSLSISVSGGYAHTSLTPYAPSGSLNGGSFYAEPQMWMRVPLPEHVALTANGGYLLGLRSYWFVTYLAKPLNEVFSVGPEIDLGGGPKYRNRVIGLRGNGNVTSRLGYSLTLGAISNSAGQYNAYASFTLNYPLP